MSNDNCLPDDFDDAELVPLGAVLTQIHERTEVAAQAAADHALSSMQQPPSNLDAERAVLGAMLVDSVAVDRVIETGLRATDFYRPAFGTIFAAIEALRLRGEPTDTLCVVDELTRTGKLESIGGVAGLASLESTTGSTAHVDTLAKVICDKSALRRVITTARDIVTRAYAQKGTARDVIAQAQERFIELASFEGAGHLVEIDRLATMQRVLEAGISGREPPGALATGFTAIDAMLRGGPRPGQMVIVAARPGMGKSVFGYQLAMAQAEREHTAFLSFEMSGDELMEREIAQTSRVPYSRWRTRSGGARVMESLGVVEGRERLHVFDCPGISLADVCGLLRKLKAQLNLGTVVIDHVGLIRASNRYAGNKVHEVTEISNTLRAQFGQLGLRGVLLSQLNRAVENRNDKRPSLADLRDSGSLEQDAQVVMFLHRPEYYLKDECPDDKRGLAEVIVAKNRGGQLGIVPLHFDGPTTSFSNARPEGGAQ